MSTFLGWFFELFGFKIVLAAGRWFEYAFAALLVAAGGIMAMSYGWFVDVSAGFFVVLALGCVLLQAGLLASFVAWCRKYSENVLLAAVRKRGLFDILVQDLSSYGCLVVGNLFVALINFIAGGLISGSWLFIALLSATAAILLAVEKLIQFYVYVIRFEHENEIFVPNRQDCAN